MAKPKQHIKNLYRRWQWQEYLHLGLGALSVALVVAAMLKLFFGWPFWMPAFGFSILLFAIRYWRMQNEAEGLERISTYLNQQYPELEQSADLLLKAPESLTRLAKIQQTTIGQRLTDLPIVFPKKWPKDLLWLSLSALIAIGLINFPLSEITKQREGGIAQPTPQSMQQDPIKQQPPVLKNIEVLISPPTYTGLKKSRASDENLTIPYFSNIQWTLQYSYAPDSVQFVLGGDQEIDFNQKTATSFQVTQRISKNNFYFIKWKGASGDWQTTDYFQIQVVQDKTPEIKVIGLDPYASFPFDPEKSILLQAEISDDYGISDARIIATVSKGEGESVKFRDDTLRFNQSFATRKKQYSLSRAVPIKTLGMEAGDELYLHFEAIDNRQPKAQITKTFKYIIALEDSTEVAMQMFGGLAVDRMPEYFRSQRQIIIDTEKLIAEEQKLDSKSFKEQSNNIGIDQKVLRLRYGKFLGEEFESVIGGNTMVEGEQEEEHDHEGHDHENHDHDEHEGHSYLRQIYERYKPDPDRVQEHDHDNQKSDHNSLEHSHAGHDHEEIPEGVETDDADEEIEELEPYAHFHDISEEVTYYDETTSAKLRAALANMWEAELHLRMGRPQEALPFEYRALKLIKQIQQASRIYVERIGFEPPVINIAEKRLSGELKEIHSSTQKTSIDQVDPFQYIRQAIHLLEDLKQVDRTLRADEKLLLQQAGEELAGIAVEQGGSLLSDLKKLKDVIDEKVRPTKRKTYLYDLQKTFWQLLSIASQPRQEQAHFKDPLRTLFLNEISKL